MQDTPTQQFLSVNLGRVDLGFGSRTKRHRWSNELSSFILQRFERKLIVSAKSGMKEKLLFSNHSTLAEICLQIHSAEKNHMMSLVTQNQSFLYGLADFFF